MPKERSVNEQFKEHLSPKCSIEECGEPVILVVKLCFEHAILLSTIIKILEGKNEKTNSK